MFHLQRAWLLLQTFAASLRPQHPAAPKKILVLTTGKLGDLVCLTSVFGAVGRQLQTTVDVVANRFGPELFAGNPHIGAVWVLNDTSPSALAARRYSHAVILNPNPELVALAVRAGIPHRIGISTPRENFWTRVFERFLRERHVYRYDQQQVPEFSQRLLSTLGVQPEPERRELFPSDADRRTAQVFWREQGLVGQTVVAMCLGAGKAYKLWPVERFAEVADHLAENYRAKILLVGSDGDKERSAAMAAAVKHHEAVVDATGQFKLLELAAVVQPCKLFIAADTGPLHVADTMKVPVVDIAGPADCVTQHPIGKYRILHPQGKERYGEMAVAFHSGSEHEERYAKMAGAVTVKQVIDAIHELVGQHHSR
ncbi:MAG: glycosyltransferase family 9 protein [bacterium]|nr:glycosyltransferase family 9 protein [bacterium]